MGAWGGRAVGGGRGAAVRLPVEGGAVIVEGCAGGRSTEVWMYVVKSPLSDANLATVSEALQGALVDLVDLALVAKQIHWNVVGPRFRSVHLQLDEVVSTARAHSDTVAERAAALGVSPDGRAATVAVGSGIGVTPEGWVDDSAAVRSIVDALGAVIARMRERIAATGEPDPVTQDVLIQVAGDLEKQHWMFQAENG
ncbi:DNA starvation/stationary phase protection protein [Streptomyces fumanus]|uniref:DNA starvation/stationary phase protection protein n=2 Tax=Streptomyces fumanus TaxID=67302 RepID=A0A919AIB9_9ACTN|nr:DNA starvation/stationary phase protection protein [Streptomyces fumanus]